MPEPNMSVWTGRVDTADGPNALRWHQMVKPLAADSPPGIVLVGFACDEGVRRNGGRVGAKDGPTAIRKGLTNLAWCQHCPAYDAGDVGCDDSDMEGAQARLAEVVADVIRAGHRPLVLGGGHETAWGTFQGIVAAKPNAKIGVINIDAHLDLRADEPGNSGTAFNQMAKWCEKRAQKLPYMCLGVSPAANTEALIHRASILAAVLRSDDDMEAPELKETREQVRHFTTPLDFVHLSIDLDVLPAAIMPAVSAPAGKGISVEGLYSLAGMALGSHKVTAVDVVEFNPRFDVDGNAVRVAARFTWDIAWRWQDQPGFLT